MTPKEGLFPNAWVLSLALLVATPLIVAQSVIAWFGTFFPQRQWDVDSTSLPHYFLSPYLVGSPEVCDDDTQQG